MKEALQQCCSGEHVINRYHNHAGDRDQDQVDGHSLSITKIKARQIAVGAIVSGANPIPQKSRGRSGGDDFATPRTGPFARAGKIARIGARRAKLVRTTTRFERRVWEGEAS
jgi:hypothetical protein